MALNGRHCGLAHAALLVPMIDATTHACILHGLPRMFQMGFLYLCIMAVTYITGGVTYAVRVPERFFPGRFDIVGQSHQILHVAVIVAVYLHFYGLCCLFHTVIGTEQCLNPITLKLGVTDLFIPSPSSSSSS